MENEVLFEEEETLPIDLNPPTFGHKEIEEALHKDYGNIPYIIDQIIPERSITMIHGDPGIGKSTFVCNLVAYLKSKDAPVFGFFEKRNEMGFNDPVVYYMQMERSKSEFFNRLKTITESIEINGDGLYVDDGLQPYTCLIQEHVDFIVKRIKKYAVSPDIIIIDPIYQICHGLSKDENASKFAKFIQLLQNIFQRSAIILIHHTHRSKYDNSGNKINEDDSFYGSQWLKALITGAFQIKRVKDGCIMECKKDNWSCLSSSIPLVYHAETDLLTYDTDNEDMKPRDKLMAFIRANEKNNKKFTFEEFMEHSRLANRTLRRLIGQRDFAPFIKVFKSNRGKKLYTFYKA